MILVYSFKYALETEMLMPVTAPPLYITGFALLLFSKMRRSVPPSSEKYLPLSSPFSLDMVKVEAPSREYVMPVTTKSSSVSSSGKSKFIIKPSSSLVKKLESKEILLVSFML